MNRWHKHILLGIVAATLWLPVTLKAQAIPVDAQYTQIYDYIDELLTDGIIVHQTAVRPYTRTQIAAMLTEAQQRDSLMDKRQRDNLRFYLNVFALERDTMVDNYVQYTDHRTFNLSLANPQFSYLTRNKMFKMSIEPLLGMDVMANRRGALIKRWWGAELKMDIAHHVSIWGSLRDVSYNGAIGLSSKYYPTANDKMYGARIAQPDYLNNVYGMQYKEASYGGDFSDSRGGLSLYAWFGSISIQRENIRWGDSYHCSNILSGHNPAVPMLSLQLTPCKWFQFDYFHAWLVSNVIDSTRYYMENTTDGTQHREYRPANKFMAANMFTFVPIKYFAFSLGNSIVYAENNPQAAYFIPIAFYKSLDHLLTKGTQEQNQNSQAFATATIRPVDHLKIYGSFYLDEFNSARLKKGNKENNPFSYLVGFDWSGWPVKGLSLKGEFMRSYIACYTHSIDVLTYASNTYNMGHYMGDNAQSIFVEAAYRPIRGMTIRLSYTNDTKYNSYPYLRVARGTGGKINPEEGISSVIAQKPFDKAIFRNDNVALDFAYEVHPNMYLRANLTYNNARGYDNLTQTIGCEDAGEGHTAQYYLTKFYPSYLHGANITGTVGFSFGF
ncbi:MAG: hypothetical protein MJZ92_00910 [Paludibacteraceae bacterium]|nr:hypothetical protein [Paludibacteraceae bacterium]